MSRTDDEIDTKAPEMIVIGDHLFMPESGELRGNDGETTVLRSQSAEVLACLAANANRFVSQAALTRAVRSDTFVTDDSLKHCIDDIRRVLEDTDHKLLEVVPGTGYRLNGQPVPETGGDPSADGVPPAPRGERAQGKPGRGLMALFFVLLLLGLLLYMMFWPGSRGEPEAGGTPRIALPTSRDDSTGAKRGHHPEAIAEGIRTERA